MSVEANLGLIPVNWHWTRYPDYLNSLMNYRWRFLLMNQLHKMVKTGSKNGSNLPWTWTYLLLVKQQSKLWDSTSLNQKTLKIAWTPLVIRWHNTHFYWVSGLCNLEGNEKAGQTATQRIGVFWEGDNRGDICTPRGILWKKQHEIQQTIGGIS